MLSDEERRKFGNMLKTTLLPSLDDIWDLAAAAERLDAELADLRDTEDSKAITVFSENVRLSAELAKAKAENEKLRLAAQAALDAIVHPDRMSGAIVDRLDAALADKMEPSEKC